jgi:hypothetical protein
MQTSVDAKRYAAEQRQQRCAEYELDSSGQALADYLDDGQAIPVGHAEFAAHRAIHKPRELNHHGVVETELPAQLPLLFRARVLRDHPRRGVTDEVEHAERKERDNEHNQHRLEQAADDKRDHDPVCPVTDVHASAG